MNFDFDYFPLIVSLIIILVTFIFASIFKRVFNRFVLNSTRIVKNDPTNYKFLKHALTSVIYVIGFSLAIYHIQALRAIASSLLAGAGIMAVAIGFASQAALSNVISGLFIIVFKPYGINDRITIRNTMAGVVEDITLRHTVIRDFENKRIVVPNSVISDEVIVNADLNDERICRLVDVGISYDSNVRLAKKIMQEEALKHPLQIDGRTPEAIEKGVDEVMVRVISMGDSSVNIRAWVWARNQPDGFSMHCDLLETIKERFDAEDIEIPFPHRTLLFKNELLMNND